MCVCMCMQAIACELLASARDVHTGSLHCICCLLLQSAPPPRRPHLRCCCPTTGGPGRAAAVWPLHPALEARADRAPNPALHSLLCFGFLHLRLHAPPLALLLCHMAASSALGA